MRLPCRVDVIAYLSPLLALQLRVVLGQTHRLVSVTEWPQIDLLVRRTVVDVAVLDPLADGDDGTRAVLEFTRRHPSVPVVLYVALAPPSLRAVVQLAQRGHAQVVLHRFDDEPARLRRLLERQPNERWAESLLARLAPAMGQLPLPLATAVAAAVPGAAPHLERAGSGGYGRVLATIVVPAAGVRGLPLAAAARPGGPPSTGVRVPARPRETWWRTS